jgi:hypothetical protein
MDKVNVTLRLDSDKIALLDQLAQSENAIVSTMSLITSDLRHLGSSKWLGGNQLMSEDRVVLGYVVGTLGRDDIPTRNG